MRRHIYLRVYKNIYFLSKVKVCQNIKNTEKGRSSNSSFGEKSQVPQISYTKNTLCKSTAHFEFSLISLRINVFVEDFINNQIICNNYIVRFDCYSITIGCCCTKTKFYSDSICPALIECVATVTSRTSSEYSFCFNVFAYETSFGGIFSENSLAKRTAKCRCIFPGPSKYAEQFRNKSVTITTPKN